MSKFKTTLNLTVVVDPEVYHYYGMNEGKRISSKEIEDFVSDFAHGLKISAPEGAKVEYTVSTVPVEEKPVEETATLKSN